MADFSIFLHRRIRAFIRHIYVDAYSQLNLLFSFLSFLVKFHELDVIYFEKDNLIQIRDQFLLTTCIIAA